MEEFAKQQAQVKNPYMAYKIYLEDLSNIVEVCTNKCINNYNDFNLNTTEKLCLEKCYFKTLEMNQFIAEEYPNIVSKDLQ
jgi:hypothetical protein